MTDLVFLLDVDNTLLDNDRVRSDLQLQVARLVSPERAVHFWSIYEEVRSECDYVDYPRTLERFSATYPDERSYAELAESVLCHPYGDYCFPGVRETLKHLSTIGTLVILSDGDPVYQPAKIARAGLAAMVGGNILIYAHKEEHLDEVVQRFPAGRYVLIDDKPRLLAATKAVLGNRLTTVHVCQGKYAHAEEHRLFPAADLNYERIGELVSLSLHRLRGPDESA